MTWAEAQHNHLRISKWTNYFWVYDRYLAPFVGKPVRMLEIGVQQGGSLELWRRYLGENARITGIDHEPRFAFTAPGIEVRVGNAADPEFLMEVVRDCGPFDIVLDDGSKIQDEVLIAFQTLYPSLSPQGVYICEDAYTSFVPYAHGVKLGGDRFAPPLHDHAYTIAKMLSVDTAQRWTGVPFLPPIQYARMTKAVSFYDSMVVFERGSLTGTNEPWEFGECRAAP